MIKSKIKSQTFLKLKGLRRMWWSEAKAKVESNRQCHNQDMITKDMQVTTRIQLRQVPIRKLKMDSGLEIENSTHFLSLTKIEVKSMEVSE